MSRRITVKSGLEISEADLAEEVVAELRRQGASSLRFDAHKQAFVNEQYDDIKDDTIANAEALYGIKLQERHAEKIEKVAKKKGYTVKKVKEDKKIKMILTQRVYTR